MAEYEVIYHTRIRIKDNPAQEQILNFDKPNDQQKWVRSELPPCFDKIQYNKQGDLILTAEQEEYAAKEVEKCKNGVHIYINGKVRYLTKKYYFYLQYWVLEDGTRPEYRDCDRRYFTYLEYWENILWCLGICRGKKRREGASSQATSNLVYEAIFYKNSNCGLISKTRDDSKDTFTDMVTFGYRHLPPFLKPKQVNKEDSVTELVFAQKSSNVSEGTVSGIKEDEGHRSKINYRAPVLNAYDRGRMSRILADEFGKLPIDVPANQLFAILAKTLVKGVKRVGFVEMPSTVNKMTKGGLGFQLIWKNADLSKKTPTVNRLVRYFVPAHDGYEGFIDQYGESVIGEPTHEQFQYLVDKWVRKDEDGNVISELSEEDIRLGAKAYIAKRRIGMEGDELEEEIRMNPENEVELFMSANADCIFDLPKLNAQIEYLTENPVPKRNIVYYRDIDGVVKWRDVRNEYLYWEWVGSLDRPPNATYREGGTIKPNRADIGVIGVDGISNEQGGKRYGSKASGWAYIKYDMRDPENTGLFIGHIYGRPKEKSDLYEQIILCAEYHGFIVYWEFVADDYYTYFKKCGRLGLLAIFPLNAIDPEKRKRAKVERHYGYPTTPFAITKGNDTMISYVLYHCDKIYWIELCEDLKLYDENKRNPFDRSVSAMITLVGGSEPIRKPPPRRQPLFQLYDNQGKAIEAAV